MSRPALARGETLQVAREDTHGGGSSASSSELMSCLAPRDSSTLTILELRNLLGFHTLIFFQSAKSSGPFFALTFLKFFQLTGLLPLTFS